jgi:NADH:ubiquinone oxidoreductase subunit F (NADH-binding)/NADH:ubiquinone oxidoreductase subunit E
MSRNLVEIIRRHHELGAPTALEVLKAALDDHGEIRDDDVRAAAQRSGLPEAAVHGVSTFYDDLLQPRGTRHVRVCTGTACFATSGGAHVDTLRDALRCDLGERAADGSVSLAETVCLGFCHSSPAVRDGDVVDAGPGVVERVLAGAAQAGREPPPRVALDEPVLLAYGHDWAGLSRAIATLAPEELLEVVKAAKVRGRGGAGFPAGAKWEFARAAEGDRKFIVANGDEGDPGSYIDKVLMEQHPELLLEGMALAGYAVGADHGFVLTRSEYPRSKPRLQAAVAVARSAGLLGTSVLGSDFAFEVTVVEGAGSYVVGEETALLACLQGLRGTVSARPPFPAQSGLHGMPTVVNNVETLCNIPYVARLGAAEYTRLSPGPTSGTKLVCFNERFVAPGVYEVRFGLTMRELCQLAGGLRDGHSIKALQIGGPLGGILPASLLDTIFDFDDLAAVGCMLGHGGIVAFDETTDMRALARHLLHFGADESCGKCFPCRIGLRRAHELFERDAPVDRVKLEALLETLELGSLCAHGSGMPAPIRSLLKHFPDELGLGLG